MSILTKYPLKETVLRYIETLGFNEFTPIQEQVIPFVLKGRDVIGISDTGTGKTHAFLIPIFQKVDPTMEKVQAVITAPTRELARQIYERAIEYVACCPDIRIRLISGEVEKSKMEGQLKVQPHIVIGTPGRLKDAFIQSEVLRLDQADILVVDEADMTLEFGFLNDVDAIAGHMKKTLQMLVFSATIPQSLQPFLKKYLHLPEMVTIEKKVSAAKVEHVLVPCKHLSYVEKLVQILPGFTPYVCLIFANTRKLAAECAETLRDHGYDVTELHGDLTTRQRKNAMKVVAAHSASYIVATDIAARGIDLEGVSHVVSLGFPNSLEYYIHRAGRTGRANRNGICFALYQEKDETSIQQLKAKGVNFVHRDLKNEQWVELRPYGQKRIPKNDLQEKEIAKRLYRKNEKVKPGYKKKKQAEIEKIKRKQRRQMIQESIKIQKKEKNRLRQRELNHGNEDW
ncbi:MAG: DEAD/DEAH box helicase [Erysipelotrichaceae bacterium]|nr:DEAD/DEAH box helicase [Erysipelotrichaceae bacterium]